MPQELLKTARKLRQDRPRSEESYVIHGDLHRGNILSHFNQWRVIDPKGYIGCIYDEIWPMIHTPKDEILYVANRLNLDEHLLLKICFVRTMVSAAWGCEDLNDTTPILGLSHQLFQLLE